MIGWRVSVAAGTRLIWHGIAASRADAEQLIAEARRLAPHLRVMLSPPIGPVEVWEPDGELRRER